MKMKDSAPSEFAWSRYLGPLRNAIKENRGATFCDEQTATLLPLVDSRAQRDDWVDIFQSMRAFGLLGGWWFREGQSGVDAAIHLKVWIRKELELRFVAFLATSRESSSQDRRDLLSRAADRVADVIRDDAFYPRVAGVLRSYNPLRMRKNPYVLLEQTVDEELRRLGVPTDRSRRRTDLGRELRRLLALPTSSPARRSLDEALLGIPAEQREFLTVMYGSGGTKAIDRLGWTGRKRSHIRRQSVASLLARLPELRAFETTDKLPG